MDKYDWGLGICLLVWGLWCYGLGYVGSVPDKLDNGCLVYGDKIYCEEVTK